MSPLPCISTDTLYAMFQLWKIHGTGVYVNWYYPFLLLGVFAHGSGGTRAASTDRGTRAAA